MNEEDFVKTLPGPGYRFSDARLAVVWHSSVPKNDEDAIAYMKIIGEQLQTNVMYVERRDPGSYEYQLLPVAYDALTDTFRKVGS